MTQEITESLLEMHYHRPMVRLFEEFFGARVFRLIKPSTRTEAFVGFDQAWVKTELSQARFVAELRKAIDQGSATLGGRVFVGYFLQFKPVDRVAKRSQKLPPAITAPYLRAAIDLRRNKSTGRSQHETLIRLSGVLGTEVHYACPMLLDPDQIYDEPDLDTLRLVPVSSAPVGYTTNQSHHIVFQDEASNDWYWCSEPVSARVYGPRDWLQAAAPKPMTSAQMLAWLDVVGQAVNVDRKSRQFVEDPKPVLPSALTILELR